MIFKIGDRVLCLRDNGMFLQEHTYDVTKNNLTAIARWAVCFTLKVRLTTA